MTNMTNMTSQKGPPKCDCPSIYLSTLIFFWWNLPSVAAPGEELSSELQRLGEVPADREKKHAINQTCL